MKCKLHGYLLFFAEMKIVCSKIIICFHGICPDKPFRHDPITLFRNCDVISITLVELEHFVSSALFWQFMSG